MAVPTTKATLKSYCLRSLGFGVIDINVSDDQADDRLDEALQYFAQYHYDGIERMYLKHLITSDDVTRARSDASTTATDTADSSITATWKEGKNFIPIPNVDQRYLVNILNANPSLKAFFNTETLILSVFSYEFIVQINIDHFLIFLIVRST